MIICQETPDTYIVQRLCLINIGSIGTETSELIMQGASRPVTATYNKLSETADAGEGATQIMVEA